MRDAIRVFILSVACAWASWGQSVAGSGAVTGLILESPEDGLPDATVTMSNAKLGIEREAVTTDDGAFYMTALPPGDGYRLLVARKGFAKWESSDFEVAVGQTRKISIQMDKEKQSVNVSIDSVTSPVESNQTGVNTWADPTQVRLLPSSQRRLDSLVLLAPTVTWDNASNRIAIRGEAASNSFLVDGIATTPGYSGAHAGIAGAMTQDNTQELRVFTANFPAEYGRAMGGVVDAVTPTGSNNFHGNVFDYYRGGGWNAPDRFSGGKDLLGKRNQGGANVSGPILKNEVFFFGNFESMTDHFDALNRITAPTLTDSTGNTIPASNCTATAAQCAAAIKFIQSQMNVVAPFSQHWIGGLGRVDYRATEANAINLEFNLRNAESPEEARRQLVAPDGGILGIRSSTEDTRYLRLGWNATPTTSSVNELRAGLVEDRYSEPPSQAGLSTGNLAITVAGATVGAAHPYATSLDERRIELVDNLTLTAGTHTVRVGGDLSKTRDNLNSLNTTGAYTYPTLTAFAQDFSGGTTKSYTSFAQQFGTAAQGVGYKEMNIYGQDTWKAIRKLDFTIGVRWDKAFLPQPSYANTNYYQTGTIASPNISVAPRASLAYSFNDNTVIRAGYGFFYTPYTGQFLAALLNGNGLTQTSALVSPYQTTAPVFPKILTFPGSAGSSNLMWAGDKLRDPHNAQATLAIERRIAAGTTVTLSIINVHATKLWTGLDTNLTIPVKTETYPIDNASGAAVGSYTTPIYTSKNDSKYAHIYTVGNSGSATYNAGSIEVRRQMRRGLGVQGSYTWSRTTGTNTGPLVNGSFALVSTPVDFTTDKGLLPTDRRQRAVVNWTWQPTLTHDDSLAARYLINGWQLSGIASVASGQPVTPTVLLTGNQFSVLTMAYYNSLNGSGGWARVPFENVGSLTTDSQRSFDFRLGRPIPITERVHAAVAFEAYNLFNMQRITAVNTVAYTAVTTLPPGVVSGPYSGVLKPAPGTGTGISAAAFPDGTSARRLQLSLRVVF